MESFEQFKLEKSKLLDALGHLGDVVGKLNEVGMDVSDALAKIESASRDIQDDVLKIALLGAFSDGKTSVIAGWLGQVMDNMKIDTDESSDSLAIYRPTGLPDRCEIVDTPGLFGDKEKSDGVGGLVQYGDITKRYLSEAHLIFYVVDATNPLKDSHKEIVRWVLRDLNKLSTTLFIINKMDEVADLRDLDDFNAQAAIKKDNLLQKLGRFVSLSEAEKRAVNVVCIASDPNGRGLDFWLEKGDVYGERSRINTLKETTSMILHGSSRAVLLHKTGIDVIADVVGQKIAAAREEFAQFQILAKTLEEDCQSNDADIRSARTALKEGKSDLFAELDAEEKRLLGRIRALQRQDVVVVLEDEIGFCGDDVGYKLRLRIDLACQRAFEQASEILQQVSVNINRQLESSARFADAVTSSVLSASSRAMQGLSKMPAATIRDGIFAARDILASVTGWTVKFKPWEAAKLAKSISTWAAPIGVGIQILQEGIEIYQDMQAAKELESLKNDLSEVVKGHFKMVYDLLKDDQACIEAFAPQLKVFEDVLRRQQEDLATLAERRLWLDGVAQELKDALPHLPGTAG